MRKQPRRREPPRAHETIKGRAETPRVIRGCVGEVEPIFCADNLGALDLV